MGALFSRLLGRQAPFHLAIAVVVMLCALWLGALDSAWTAPPGHPAGGYVGLRIAAVAGVCMATFTASLLLAEAWTDAVRMRWWDPADRPDGELGWDRLIELVHRHHDPLIVPGGLRVGAAVTGLLLLVPAVFALAGVAETLAGLAWHPAVPEALLRLPADRTRPDALVNLSGNLTAFLALIAASVSIWFTYSQLRAKVRADNRQEWLGRTRALFGRVIALAAAHAEAPSGKRARIFLRLDPLRLELELMLNPSEKDHRLLMYLLRRLTFINDPGRADQADEGVLVAEIREACRRMALEQPARYGSDRYELDWRPVLEAGRAAPLVTYCMRLGHVVLKREWERVKTTR